MAEDDPIAEQTARIMTLMRAKLGVRSKTFPAAMRKAGRRLPRSLRQQGEVISGALPLADHPKLRQTIDRTRIDAATAAITEHLSAIDIADRRKGWWLGMLGGMAFNILLFIALMIAGLKWFGYI